MIFYRDQWIASSFASCNSSFEFSLLVYAHTRIIVIWFACVWEIYSCKKRSSHWIHYQYLLSMNIYYIFISYIWSYYIYIILP